MTVRFALRLVFALTLAGCGDDDDTMDAATGSDSSVQADGNVGTDARIDAPTADDASTEDSSVDMDAGNGDAGNEDAGSMDSGAPDAEPPMMVGGGAATSVQIAAVRAAAVGAQTPALDVDDAVVTYVLAAVGEDPAGFFLQAERNGPALFVVASVTPAPAAGDVMSIEVDETAVVDGQHRVTGVAASSRASQGNSVAFLVQDLSAAADIVSAVGDYESELITIAGTLTNAAPAGTDLRKFDLSTTGVPDDGSLELRGVATVLDAAGAAEGCRAEVGPTPLWRFNDNAQTSVWNAAELVVTCEPEVTDAFPIASDRVVVELSLPLDPSTVMASDFAIAGLTVSAAQVDSTDGRFVVLTVSAMSMGMTYTVVVSNVSSEGGDAIGASNMATFMGIGTSTASPSAAGQLVISEIFYDWEADAMMTDDDGREWFELHNPGSTALQLYGCTLVDSDADNAYVVRESAVVPAGGYVVVGETTSEASPSVGLQFGLNNGGDTLSVSCGGLEIDRVEYDDASPWPVDPLHVSIQLDPDTSFDATVNDAGGSWCAAMATFGTAGQRGTPGAANDCDGGMMMMGSGTLVFSEYIEGSSNNKALEITNLGAATTLDGCRLELYRNGGSASTVMNDLSGPLGMGASIVLCDNPFALTMSTTDPCDVRLGGSGSGSSRLDFNGDDALAIICPVPGGGESIVDSIGATTGDPGSQWITGGVGTENQTLRRRCPSPMPDTDLSDAYDPSAVFTAHPMDDVADLGTYSCS